MTKNSSTHVCLRQLIEIIEDERQNLTNRRLLEITGEHGTFSNKGTDPHFPHELLETALNSLISSKYAAPLLRSDEPEKAHLKILRPIINRLPTQTWRSKRQEAFQQYSTPPPISYFLTYLLKLKPQEVCLEPSAGTGNLAVWARAAGANVLTNEIDQQRAQLLRYLRFQPTSFNAEFIDDFLPETVAIDSVLMNPPFSATGGRTKNNSSKYGFRHVESALTRLRPGGRFGIILGSAGGLAAQTGRDFWQRISERISLSAVITIDGREYYKNGTSVDITVILGTKLIDPYPIPWEDFLSRTAVFAAKSIEDAFNESSERGL